MVLSEKINFCLRGFSVPYHADSELLDLYLLLIANKGAT